MFQSLTNKFEGIFERLSKKGVLNESDVDEALKEIRVALLEADVNLKVVKSLRNRIKERAVGEEVHKALNPAQQVVKIVNEELTASLGGEAINITYASKPPTVVLMAGLQGSGKTTTSGKLAKWFKARGRNPLLVGADLQRPAAVEQLRTLGEQVDVPVYSDPSNPVNVAAQAIEEAKRTGRDVVIVDTAGRLAIDEVLMEEVRQISDAVVPDYTFLVVDAMTGQDAVNVAEAFHQKLSLDGVILTKLDGDARGGAALSVKEVVGRPIAFAATGEKLDEFDLFHPDRMASRILGMGDMLTLIEKAEETFEKDQAEEAAARMLEGQFTFDDFIDTMNQLKKMGPLQNLVGMMPGLPKEARDVEIDDREVARLEAMVTSMTPQERLHPEIIDASRRTRIAAGSGTKPGAVSDLVKQFMEMRKMMKRFGNAGTKRIKKNRKKSRKKGKGKGGGRVTQKGGGRVKDAKKRGRTTPKGTKSGGKSSLSLPGLDNIKDSELEQFGRDLEDLQ